MQFAWLIPSVILGVYLGASSGAWHMLIMSLGGALSWLGIKRLSESREIDLSEPVRIDGEVAWIGDYQLPRYEIFWKKKWHSVVYAAYRANQTVPKFELELGLEAGVGHAIILGPTGSGKSELLKQILKGILESNPNCELTLIDFKGGATFCRFQNLRQVKSLISDIDGHDPQVFWRGIQTEIAKRELYLAAQGHSRIEDLEAFVNSMPRHYIFVDELVAALAESAAALAALNSVAARGRSLGIHLVAATQSSQGLSRSILTNLRARIALAEADPIELAQLNMKRPAEFVKTPDGWASGILQKPGESSSYFNFPLGASFGF